MNKPTAIFAYLDAAQHRYRANQVAILRTLEPLAAGFSFWLLGETFNTFDVICANMVLTAMILVLIYRNNYEGSLSGMKLESD